MSQIHIVIGFKTASLQSEVEPVYVGRSGVEAEAAIKARTDLAQFHWSRGLPRGVIKRNSNVQPLALPVPAATGPEAQSPSYEELKDALTEAVAHIAALKDQIEAMGAPSQSAPPAETPTEGANTTYNAPETALSDVTISVTDATSSESTQTPSAPASPGSLSPGRRRGGGGNGTGQ